VDFIDDFPGEEGAGITDVWRHIADEEKSAAYSLQEADLAAEAVEQFATAKQC
jgi:hypothetical protein